MRATEAHKLHVRLEGIEPPIWRRLRVPADLTLSELHVALQAAMGWENYHLYEFRVRGGRFAEPDPEPDDWGETARDAGAVSLADLDLGPGDEFVYRYDFGDGWTHRIRIEDVEHSRPEQPLATCLDGARRCPPEDCGGPPGYEGMLEALSDPDRPEHDEWSEWVPSGFDPEVFSAGNVNARLRALTETVGRFTDDAPRMPEEEQADRAVVEDRDSPATHDARLERITTWPVGMPVRDMEWILKRSEGAVPAVAAALEQWRESEDHDYMWLLVLLGELRRPEGVEPLLEELVRAVDDSLQSPVAAAEGLARIGEPAVARILERLPDLPVPGRIHAYAALGWIGGDTAYVALVADLSREPDLADAVAPALASLGRKGAIPALYEAFKRAEPWQRFELRDAIHALDWEVDREPPHEEDWRLRYRRRPVLGTFPPSWPYLAAVCRKHPDVIGARTDMPVCSLEEILAESPEPEPPPERCKECGAPIERPTGLPVCPESAVAAVSLQLAFLREGRELGREDLFQLLDDADAGELMCLEDGEPTDPGRRLDWQEELERTRAERATYEWLVRQGVEYVSPAKALLLAHMARLADRHGDPQGLLSRGLPGSPAWRLSRSRPASRMRPADGGMKPGRNEPCPCGSGRKYKRCCGSPT